MCKKMIVISSPTSVVNEVQMIRQLFSDGLTCFHLRKPDLSWSETRTLLESIGLEHHSKIVLHQYFDMTQIFKINQIHWNEIDRNQLNPTLFRHCTISTSTHSIEEFNNLGSEFSYAFLSPIFPSISKNGYQVDLQWNEELKKRTLFTTELIALAGICPSNIQQVLQLPFDGFALLGCIWNQINGYKNFKLCQQIAQ